MTCPFEKITIGSRVDVEFGTKANCDICGKNLANMKVKGIYVGHIVTSH